MGVEVVWNASLVVVDQRPLRLVPWAGYIGVEDVLEVAVWPVEVFWTSHQFGYP